MPLRDVLCRPWFHRHVANIVRATERRTIAENSVREILANNRAI